MVKTIRSRGPSQTQSITAGLRAAGQSYKVVSRRGNYGWNAPAQGRPTNPGRGAPSQHQSSIPVTTYTRGPGGFTQRYAPPSLNGNTALGGFPAHASGAIAPSSRANLGTNSLPTIFPAINPGYSHPVIDPVTGDTNFLTTDYLNPDGRILREPTGLQRELPEMAGILEHANDNPGYWNDELSTFAGNNPGFTTAVGIVGGGLAIGVANRYVQAAGAVRQALRRSAPVGFNTRPRGGSGSRFSALPSSPFEFMR